MENESFEKCMFKIDLIVWKFSCNNGRMLSDAEFKIDLIVWK